MDKRLATGAIVYDETGNVVQMPGETAEDRLDRERMEFEKEKHAIARAEAEAER